ncbi:MAG: hypothetical protein JSS07_01410 [Proteobacteria bacterium]|nr:hypothetical protein [Pseudomonadota bacterium]
MLLRAVFFIMIGFYVQTIYALGSHKNGCAHTFGKGCQFSTSGQLSFKAKAQNREIPLDINQSMQGKMNLYHSQANHVDSVRGSFILNNQSNSSAILNYHVILKDNKGAVAQTKGSFHLKPGQHQKVKLSNMVISNQDIKNLRTYEIKIVGSH